MLAASSQGLDASLTGRSLDDSVHSLIIKWEAAQKNTAQGDRCIMCTLQRLAEAAVQEGQGSSLRLLAGPREEIHRIDFSSDDDCDSNATQPYVSVETSPFPSDVCDSGVSSPYETEGTAAPSFGSSHRQLSSRLLGRTLNVPGAR